MSIYVYRRAASNGARELIDALNTQGANARRVRNPDTLQRIPRNSSVVFWGDTAPVVGGVKILNNVPVQSKFSDAERLTTAGVRTVRVSRTRPTTQGPIPVDPLIGAWEEAIELADAFTKTTPQRGQVAIASLDELITHFNLTKNHARVAAPVAPQPVPEDGWLPRSNSHVGGNDLLDAPTTPDFWVKKEEFVREYRVHSFLQKSIRAGIKEPRGGFTVDGAGNSGRAHPWIRSWDGGWRIVYRDGVVKQAHRDIAHAAVKALGLDFGAVDIGETASGELVVLEVNRAPGVELGTSDKYAEHISQWANS